MLLRFRVTNHASLRDEQQISLVADGSRQGRAEGTVPRSSHRTVPVAAIYGPNASGKSNVIHAVAWMRRAVLSSFSNWDPAGGVPRKPFAFRRDVADHPSEFNVEFVLEGVRYEYGFTCDDDRVREEWLFSYPEGKPRRLYERQPDGTLRFGRALTGRLKVIAELLRPNSLYLSVAAAQGHPLLGAIFRWFQRHVGLATEGNVPERIDYTIAQYVEGVGNDEDQALTGLLRFADLGVSALELQEPDPEAKVEQERVLTALRKAVGAISVRESVVDRVRVEHRTPSGVFNLPFGDESSGTRMWIGLLGPVLKTLERGSVLCVDELDARLHPHLTDVLVGMFQSAQINQHGAQLVFSTHETSLLGRSSRTELFRDQVWFTEKDEAGATKLFPMTDFQVRADTTENFEKRYLVGRYGALPFFDEDLLEIKRGRGVAPEEVTRPHGKDAA